MLSDVCEVLAMNNYFDIIVFCILVILLIMALYTDIREQKITNKVTVPAIVSGIILSTVQGLLPGLGKTLKDLLVMFAVVFALFALKFIGAGDGKLLLAIAALKGLSYSIGVTVYAVFIGAIMTIFMARDKSLKISFKAFINDIKNIFLSRKITMENSKEKKAVKFAIPVSIACLIEWILPFYSIFSQ